MKTGRPDFTPEGWTEFLKHMRGPLFMLRSSGVIPCLNASVYRAKDTRLDRVVAVKVLPYEVAHNPEKRQRFERKHNLFQCFPILTSARCMTLDIRTVCSTWYSNTSKARHWKRGWKRVHCRPGKFLSMP
jgi:hypothetical protein